MKLKSIYLVSMALLASVFAACNDNDVENFDNQVYINGSAMTSTVLLKNTVSDTEGSFRISMARPESQDITIALKLRRLPFWPVLSFQTTSLSASRT